MRGYWSEESIYWLVGTARHLRAVESAVITEMLYHRTIARSKRISTPLKNVLPITTLVATADGDPFSFIRKNTF